jgi:hypothetical protein
VGEGTHADIVGALLDPGMTIDPIELEAMSNQIVLGPSGMTLVLRA